MKGIRRPLLVAVLVSSLAVGMPLPAHAGILPDPGTAAELLQLVQITQILGDIYAFLHKINAAVSDTRTRLATHFPLQALQGISTIFTVARSIEDEITDLSCRFNFSLRGATIPKLLQGLGTFCKKEYEFLFGVPLPGPDQDLREMEHWGGAIRYNQAADVVQRTQGLVADAQDLEDQARAAGNPSDPNNPYSVAYSARLQALAAADALKAAASANSLAAADVWAAQEDLDATRREDWHRDNVARLMKTWMTQYQSVMPASPPNLSEAP